jgi:hypothetical protein
MPKPRVFVSSTFYDLRYIRASLETLVSSLGFEPVLSERGAVTYSPDTPLDASCYRDVTSADIFVLIVGGRYGSPTSATQKPNDARQQAQFESITRAEFRTALERDIPCYILMDSNVAAEFDTFRRNADRCDLRYAHVDSVNVFHFIEHILAQPQNNPVCKFQTFAEIESFLRLQWAGLFQELLRRNKERREIEGLSAQVTELAQISKSMKNYLEAILLSSRTEKSQDLIEHESARIREAETFTDFATDPFWIAAAKLAGTSLESLFSLAKDNPNVDSFIKEAFRLDGRDFSEETGSLRKSDIARHLLALTHKLATQAD